MAGGLVGAVVAVCCALGLATQGRQVGAQTASALAIVGILSVYLFVAHRAPDIA